MKLFIDSATSYLYLALTSKNINDVYIRFGKNDHSETLVDNLELFLKRNNVEPKEIEEVFIGRGPGSYTGIRIAGTVGKVLSYTTKAKFYSFSSLDLLMANHLERDGKYLARIIAKKNYSYIKVIDVKNLSVEVIMDDSFVEDEKLKDYHDYQEIMISETLLNDVNLAKNILKHHLYQEEDVYNYVPNYLRSGI